jgi:hypothetical protein
MDEKIDEVENEVCVVVIKYVLVSTVSVSQGGG